MNDSKNIARTNTLPALLSAVLILLLSGLLCGFTGFFRKDYMDIRVMTYNIRVGVGGGKDRLPSEEGLKKVARIIKKHKPDILMLQEVDINVARTQFVDQAQWIMHHLGFPQAAFAPAIQEGTSSYGVAIFSRFPNPMNATKFNLFKPDYPNRPDYFSEQRVLLKATQEIKGIPFTLLCTHLGLTSNQRVEQVNDIMRHTEDITTPIIFGGDFNSESISKEMRPLKARFYDVFDGMRVDIKQRLTFPAGLTPGQALDTIYATADLKVISAKVILDKTLASDHNPVIAVLRIDNKRQK